MKSPKYIPVKNGRLINMTIIKPGKKLYEYRFDVDTNASDLDKVADIAKFAKFSVFTQSCIENVDMVTAIEGLFDKFYDTNIVVNNKESITFYYKQKEG